MEQGKEFRYEEFAGKMQKVVEEVLGNGESDLGVIRCELSGCGVSGLDAVLEVTLEKEAGGGMNYPLCLVGATLLIEVPEEAIVNILLGINELNDAILTGALSSYGIFSYNELTGQILYSYRKPIILAFAESELCSMKQVLEQMAKDMDMLSDFFALQILLDKGIRLDDYMNYLDMIADWSKSGKDLNSYVNFLKEELREKG